MTENNICYYCNSQVFENDFLYKFNMYHVLSRDIGLSLIGIKKTTRYYERELTIKRCSSCYSIHKNSNQPALITALVSSAVGMVLGWYFGKRWYVALGAAAATFVVALITYFHFIYRKKLKKLNIKDQFEIREHPDVKIALENGWQLTKI